MSFSEKLTHIQQAKQSLLCVGLDPDVSKIPRTSRRTRDPEETVVAFNAAIIEATAPFACAFKLNFAFFEALGVAGWRALERTRALLPDDVISIADAKRGDIGNSASFYAQSIFEDLAFDSCTVAPYMGRDSIEPFLKYPGRAVFVLARTSNPGAADLQELEVDGEKLYLRTARMVRELRDGQPGEAGLVVGATEAAPVLAVREQCPDMPFLIPGVGAQGGDPARIIQSAGRRYGLNLINSSRQILYASPGNEFAEAAAAQAHALRDQLRAIQRVE